MHFEDIVSTYTDEKIKDITGLPGGHINRSFLITTAKDRYVLQLMCAGLYADSLEALSHNYNEYVYACEHRPRRMGKWYWPEWLKNADGDHFTRDEEGGIWRMYRYIPSDITPEEAKEIDGQVIGEGLGKLHRILKKCEDLRPVGSGEALYDLFFHYRKYKEQDGSAMDRIEEIDRIIQADIESRLEIYPPGGNAIHGDAKVANMIFRGGKVAGFIDLDTVMRGSVFNDLADCVRSCCMDEEGKYDLQKVSYVRKGYEEGADTKFTESAVRLLDQVMARNRFMLGLRYYTDYLAQGTYFADMTPVQKLERARDLLIV